MEGHVIAARRANVLVQGSVAMSASKYGYTRVAQIKVSTLITAKENGSAQRANGIAQFFVP